MHHFEVKRGKMACEGVPLRRIAEAVGTPVYVYSHATLSQHYKVFDDAFAGIPHVICYSMKANSSGAVIRTFTSLGSGVDIVSGGELARALQDLLSNPARLARDGEGERDIPDWHAVGELEIVILEFYDVDTGGAHGGDFGKLEIP
jgi:diaminopimelate decarboxylase